MKILLVQPPMSLFPWEKCSPTPPLGLAYVAGFLEYKGHDVRILDAFGEGRESVVDKGNISHFGLSWSAIDRRIRQVKPDVVGVNSLYSSQAGNMRRVARLVKEYDKNIPVVVGGAHPSSLPYEVLENEDIDYVVLGEGEHTFHKITEYLESIQQLDTIEGIGYRKNGRIRVNPKMSYVECLDELPLPARHLLRMERYGSSRGAEQMRKPCSTMITSRGCPMNCVFCSVHSVFGWKWRSRSAKNVINEISLLVEEYGIREIQFEDDNIALNRKRMEEICDLMIKKDLDIRWTTPNGIAIWTLDAKLLKKMKKSGCYSLSFGIESGDPNTLKFIGKPVNLAKAKEVIKQANKIGIYTHGFFVFGFPYENLESIMLTLRFAVESDLDLASFYIATPYPKTRLYEIMKREKMLLEDNWEMFRTMKAVANTKYFNKEDLDTMQTLLYKTFFKKRIANFLKPKTLLGRLRRLNNPEDLRFMARLGLRFLDILKKR